jgi:Tfp pilus assembly protein PilW
MLRLARARTTTMRHEGGFTLPELAVATTVTLIIGVAVLSFIVLSARQYTGQEDRVTTTDEARNALLRITNELRDAGAVTWVDQGTVQAEARASDGTFHQVTYSCDTGTGGTSTCTRTDATTSDEELLVEGVVNANNFRLIAGSDLTGTTSEGGAVEIRLELDLDDTDNPIVLSSAVRPRNCSTTAGVINPCS